ncbi:MAG: hypothetical protein R2784_06300 [Saprospiraceae bacterium]
MKRKDLSNSLSLAGILCLAVLFFLIIFQNSLSAQSFEESEITKRRGWFVSGIFDYIQAGGNFETLTGLGAGMILNDFHAGLFWQNGNLGIKLLDDNNSYEINQEVVGLAFGYQKPATKFFHFQCGLKLGYGTSSLQIIDLSSTNPALYNNSSQTFSVQPEIGGEMNVFKWLRVAMSFGYRDAFGYSGLRKINTGELSGLTYGFTVKLGNFGYTDIEKENMEF